MMTDGRLRPHPAGLTARCPVHWRSREGACLVSEDAAIALVADAAQALARRGYDPVIGRGREVRLVRLGALMLAEFGVAAGPEPEDDDG